MRNSHKRALPLSNSERGAISLLAFLIITAFMSCALAHAAHQLVDNEAVAAKKTLVDFFFYLQAKQFDKAILLFEPSEATDCDSNPDSWEGLESFSLPEERGVKAKVLENYCRSVRTCLKASVIGIKELRIGKYELRVSLLKDDGTLFSLGACCGVEDADPPKTSFAFCVEKVNGIYKVRTAPVFAP